MSDASVAGDFLEAVERLFEQRYASVAISTDDDGRFCGWAMNEYGGIEYAVSEAVTPAAAMRLFVDAVRAREEA